MTFTLSRPSPLSDERGLTFFVVDTLKGALKTKEAKTLALLFALGGLYMLKRRWKKLAKRNVTKERLLTRSLILSRDSGSKDRQKRVAVDWLFLKRLASLLRIIIPSLASKEFFYIVALTILLISRTQLTITIAEIMGRNAKMLVERNFPEFVRGVIKLGLIAVPASMVNSGLKWTTSMMNIDFRKRLSRYVHRLYMKDMTFYKATAMTNKIDNADQRITQDVEKFCNSISSLYSNTFKPTVDLVLFTVKLSRVLSWQGPVMMYLYYILSGVAMKLFMPPFARLTSEQQKLEGDFRYSHSRLITHAEEIAFYGGAQREEHIINQRFDAIYKHSKNVFTKQALVGIFDGLLVKYGATLVGYAVVALPVFGALARTRFATQSASNGGAPAIDPTSAITGDYIRNTQILINLARAIGQIVLLYKNVTALAGYAARVSELLELVDTTSSTASKPRTGGLTPGEPAAYVPRGRYQDGDLISFDHVDIITPDGTLLVRDLSFSVLPGQNFFIAGPNGSGKSSLFRILSELWPVPSGTVTKPLRRGDIFYIPQKPYLTLGTLRDQIIYPHGRSEMAARGVTDEDLDQLLAIVKLGYIVRREDHGWDAVQDWADVLSGGEKQRVAMARLFYHRPRFAILDECTSAVSIDVEGELYTRCKMIGTTLVTVSHRQSLWKFHEYYLKFDGEGGWETGVFVKTSLPNGPGVADGLMMSPQAGRDRDGNPKVFTTA